MRHRKHKNRVGSSGSHRIALIKTMTKQLILNESIETTHSKAKAVRIFAEKIITEAIKISITSNEIKQVHHVRLIKKRLSIGSKDDKEILEKLVREIAPRYILTPGGYLRIIKTRYRKGDGAPMAIIELVQ